MKLINITTLAAVAALSFTAPSFAEGDAAEGATVFKKCKACHSLEVGKKKIGPSLAGVLGRTAGTSEGYKYSKAMKAYGVVWSEETLAVYLVAPRKVVKGTKMGFPGLKKPEDIANLLAYLKENGGS